MERVFGSAPPMITNGVEIKRAEIKPHAHQIRAQSDMESVHLRGWLREVNWDKNTAQLHSNGEEYVTLQFSPPLGERMRRLAKQYVEIEGEGHLSAGGSWGHVRVKMITGTRSWSEPFDREAFLNDPDPKIFDTENLVTASEPFDVDEFNRIIHEGRDSGP